MLFLLTGLKDLVKIRGSSYYVNTYNPYSRLEFKTLILDTKMNKKIKTQNMGFRVMVCLVWRKARKRHAMQHWLSINPYHPMYFALLGSGKNSSNDFGILRDDASTAIRCFVAYPTVGLRLAHSLSWIEYFYAYCLSQSSENLRVYREQVVI